MAAAAHGKAKAAGHAVPAWDQYSVQKAIPMLYAQGKLSGGDELCFLECLYNRTFIVSRKPKTPAPEECKLSYSQIAADIGAKGTYATDVVQRVVTRLKKAGIIAVRKEEGKQVLWYRLTPDRWAAAPKYEPPKPAKVVELPAPDAVEEEDSQLALAGLEHIALATAQARSFKLDVGTSEVRIVNEGVPIDVGRRRRGNALEFVLRSAGYSTTPDLQVGGSKSGHSAMVAALVEAMSKLGHGIDAKLARSTLAAAGWADVDFLVAKVQDSIRRAGAKRQRWTVGFLKVCAADIAAAWPAEKQLRAAAAREAVAQEARTRRCRECGMRVSECECRGRAS